MDEISLGIKQIALIIAFILVLVSIPAASILVKKSQSLNSKASEPPKQTTNPGITPKPIPANSSITDLQGSIESTSSSQPFSTTPNSSTTPAPTDGSSSNISFGPTLDMSINIQGRNQNDNSVSAFVGIASGPPTIKPTYILTFTVNFPSSGVFKGLSLAGLNPGSVYTAYIKGPGQIDSGVQFTMSNGETQLNNNQPIVLISGDLNEDNTINAADYAIALKAYGSTPTSSNWNARADFNNDGLINNLDIAYILSNIGKTGTSGLWYSPPPPASPSASLSTHLNIGGGVVDSVSSTSGSYWLRVP